jgi:hypothetical protein
MARGASLPERLRYCAAEITGLLGVGRDAKRLLLEAADALDRANKEIARLQEIRSRMAGTCRMVLRNMEGPHPVPEINMVALRAAIGVAAWSPSERPGGPPAAAEPKAARTTVVGPDGAVWGWET